MPSCQNPVASASSLTTCFPKRHDLTPLFYVPNRGYLIWTRELLRSYNTDDSRAIMSHTEATLPKYIERDLAATLERLNITADSEEGQEAREKAFARHQNKLQAARLRRANKKAALAAAAPEPEEDRAAGTAEKKNDDLSSSASETLSPTKKPRKKKASAASPEAPEASCEPTSELVPPKSSLKRGKSSVRASSRVTLLNID